VAHSIVLLSLADAPDTVYELFSQVSPSGPASATAPGIIVNIIDEISVPHIPLPSEVTVKVSVTSPVSSLSGIYVGNKVVSSYRVPAPFVVHNKVLLLLADAPLITYAFP